MIAYFKTEIPFVRLVLFFIIGITTSVVYNIQPSLYYPILWLILSAFLFVSLIFFKKVKVYLHSSVLGFLVYLLMILSGVIICNQHKEIFKTNHFSKKPANQLMVSLIEEPRIKGDIARFIVKVTENIQTNKIVNTRGKLLLAMRFDTTQKLDLHYGDLIIIKSKFKETEPPYNPSEFNYKRFLSFQQIYHQSFINQKETKKIGSNTGNPIIDFALKFREKQVVKFNSVLKDSSAKAIASTLILGYRADLGRDILETYSKTGTMHVLSVSGMHVGIVVYLLTILLGFMNKSRRGKILQAAIIIFLVWFYSLITGLSPSVERAALMITLIMIAKATNKKVNIFNAIGFAAFILLIYDPFNLTNVGFQLSFIAVAGLIYLQPKIYGFYDPQNKILKFLWSLVSVSLAAQIATAPLSLYYFHQFPVYFILSNLFIFIPSTLIMYFGLAFLSVSFFAPLMNALGYLLEKTILFNNMGLRWIEHIPHANVTQIWLNIFEIALFYFFCMFFIAGFKNKKMLQLSFIFLLFLIVSLSYKTVLHIKQKQVLFFSLRKNTGIALIKGRNATLISDLKEDEFTFLFSVKPYLDSCHVDYIQIINPHLNATEKLISFEGKKIKIINHKNYGFHQSISNWLLLSSDKIYNLNTINQYNTFDELFIDGKNRDFVIENLQKQAKAENVKTYTLKRYLAKEIKIE